MGNGGGGGGGCGGGGDDDDDDDDDDDGDVSIQHFLNSHKLFGCCKNFLLLLH